MAERPLTDWESGLFDCFEDPGTCCYGFWCSICLACTVSRRFGENNCIPLCDLFCSGTACGLPVNVPPVAFGLRASMRNKYGIKGSLGKDMFATCLCTWCAWCQMHRELKHRHKAPVVISMQSQTVLNVQPAPMMMVPAYNPQVNVIQTGYMQGFR